MTSRGIRNNNPGNIRHSPTRFQGQAKSQPDKAFKTFIGPEWGLRAIAKILLTYETHGVDTVREIITRWAPPVENDTKAYIAAVAKSVGRDDHDVLNLRNPELMVPMLQAIVTHENGCQPYPACTFIKAVQLAGLEVKRAA